MKKVIITNLNSHPNEDIFQLENLRASYYIELKKTINILFFHHSDLLGIRRQVVEKEGYVSFPSP